MGKSMGVYGCLGWRGMFISKSMEDDPPLVIELDRGRGEGQCERGGRKMKNQRDGFRNVNIHPPNEVTHSTRLALVAHPSHYRERNIKLSLSTQSPHHCRFKLKRFDSIDFHQDDMIGEV